MRDASSVTRSPISRRSSIDRSDSASPRSSTCGRKGLAAREGEQLPHQARRPVGILLDLHDVLERRVARLVSVEQEVGRHHDGGEHVVEVVGDAAGELADHLHLLGLVELALQHPLVGGLDGVDDGRLGIALRFLHRSDVEPRPAFALAGERGIDRRHVGAAAGRLGERLLDHGAVARRRRRRGWSGPAPPPARP